MASTYNTFIESEDVPVVATFAIPDLAELEVAPWERIGGEGCYVHLDGRGPSNAFISQIAPGHELKEQRHFFEESVFVVNGSGRTEMWNDAGFTTAFNWEKGAVFAIPLNVHYRHINQSTSEPARLFSITNEPLMMNLTPDPELVFNLDHDFEDRFNPAITDFTKPVQIGEDAPRNARTGVRWFHGNVIPSAYDVSLPSRPERGAGGNNLHFDLAGTTLGIHISEFPPKTYKKAHRHGPGAHVVLLSGTGYSLLWKADEEPIRVDWKPGAVLVPPDRYFHQHFNVGDDQARYLALRFGGGGLGLGGGEGGNASISTREGGDQIEYDDEDPRIRGWFEQSISGTAG